VEELGKLIGEIGRRVVDEIWSEREKPWFVILRHRRKNILLPRKNIPQESVLVKVRK
jgi:hypothetical protein